MTAKGKTKFVEERWRIEHDGQGKPLRAVGTCQDITRRIHENEALRVSEARRKVATDSGRVAIWEVDLKTNHLTWDDNCFLLYGVAKEGFKGTFDEWMQALHPKDLEAAVQAFQNSVAGIGQYHHTFRIVRPGGEVRFVEGHGQILRDPSGVAQRVIGTNWDITESKQLESKLLYEQTRLKTIFDSVHRPNETKQRDSVRVSVVRFRAGPPEFKANCSRLALSFLDFPRATRGSGRFCLCHRVRGWRQIWPFRRHFDSVLLSVLKE